PVSGESIRRDLLAVSSLAFVLLPAAAAALATWWGRLRAIDVAVGILVGLLLVGSQIAALVATGTVPQVLLDDLMTQWGTPGPFVLAGGRPVLFPDGVWAALNGLALVATVVVLGTGAGILGARLRRMVAARRLVLDRLRSAAGLLAVFAVVMSTGLEASGLVWTMIDRYLWVLVPPLAALLLVPRGELDDSVEVRSLRTDTPANEGATRPRARASA